MAERIVGIDLGTTYSLVAAVIDERPTVLSHNGEKLLPSVVGFGPAGELLVGTPARNQLAVAPERTVKSIKRRMGNPEPVQLGNRSYTPPEISAFILRELKRRAEAVLGEPITRAVITLPARFTDAQRQATRDAGEIAGFEVARIINEPTAAALAYGLDRAGSDHALAYDLGGGTFDVSAVELSDGIVEVRASHGNPNLGGDDFDTMLAQQLAKRVEERHKVNPMDDRRAAARLLQAAERAKIALSDAPYATVREEHLLRGVNLEMEVSREELEDLIRESVRQTLQAVDRALADAGWRLRDVDDVLLVGGSTRIPLVRHLVAQHLGQTPRAEIHPDEAVALGAAVQAAIVAGEPIEAVLVDVAPYSLGIRAVRFDGITASVDDKFFSVVIPRNTTIPSSKSEHYYTLTPAQDKVEIEVYQGEARTVDQNTSLGKFMFENISPNPSGGEREVLVTFDYDVDGIVHVTARDRHSDRRADIKITAPVRHLSEDEKARARAAVEAAPAAETDATVALRRRAEDLRANLLLAGKDDVVAELESILEGLDRAADAETREAVLDRLVDWIYEHEEDE
ncbi:MAG: Hsp70 family protein [Chloroflexi bacterium]|nr:Hsp70 family protein [Chloroflexota bacterium]